VNLSAEIKSVFQNHSSVILKVIVQMEVMKLVVVSRIMCTCIFVSLLYFNDFNLVPVQFQTTPPPLITLEIGEVFITTCKAVGLPIPEISWRLNWGHVPTKCEMTSVNGLGTLTCPNIQVKYL